MGAIEVRGISFLGRHGCYPEERLEGRRFEVDIVVWIDTQKAAATDKLSDTLDYNKICAVVVELGEKESFHLIERLAHEMLNRVLALGSITEAEVTVRKYVPGLAGNPPYVAVKVRSSNKA